MAPRFSFPPPPPPPPPQPAPQSDHAHSSARRGRGGSRGRGGFSTGRGNHSSPPEFPSPSQIQPSLGTGRYTNPQTGHSDFHQGQKRKFDDTSFPRGIWRGGRGQSRGNATHPMRHPPAQSRSAVAPSVPSFGAALPFSSPVTSKNALQLQAANTLGLTPSDKLPLPTPTDDASDSGSEDDADEEAAFGDMSGVRLRFEHNGEIIVLETAADLKNWSRDRRKHFPSRSRVEGKQMERQVRMDERRRIELETAAVFSGRSVDQHGVVAIAGSRPGNRAEQLREQLLKDKQAKQDRPASLSKVETSSSTKTQDLSGSGPALKGLVDYDSDGSEEHAEPPTQQAQEEPSWRSESASDSDSSSSPEIQSSKTVPSDLAVQRGQKPCHFFSQTGRCKHGDQCHFQHVQREDQVGLLPRSTAEAARRGMRETRTRETKGRKTLYQRLVEQEQEQENKLAIQAIRYLGDLGFFRLPESSQTDRDEG